MTPHPRPHIYARKHLCDLPLGRATLEEVLGC